MRRGWRDKVIVITGGSSGIGRLAARELARRGAIVVLAARNEPALEEAARDCGPRAVALPVDVADETQVRRLAEHVADRFGKTDVWINNAAVTLFSRLEDAPTDLIRRVIETNLFGYLHGARAVLSHFRRQERGTLINVGSVNSKVPLPFVAPYVMSKHAVVALSDCLRQELRHQPGIRVCTLLPASIDTPLFQHAGNLVGRQPKPMNPVYATARAVRALVRLVERPRRELPVGTSAWLMLALRRLFPGWTEKLMARLAARDHFNKTFTTPHTGNLLGPSAQPYAVSGGWRRTRAWAVPLVIGAGIGGLWLLGRSVGKSAAESTEEGLRLAA